MCQPPAMSADRPAASDGGPVVSHTRHAVGDHKEMFVSVQYCCYFLCFKYAVYSCTEIQYCIHSYFVIIAHTDTILWTFLNCTAVSAGSVLCGQILAFPNDYFVSVKVQTIEMSMSLCLCNLEHVSKNKMYKFHQIFIAVAVSRSSSAGISIYYILLVLWMTSCLPIISLIQNQLAGSLCENHSYWHMLIQCDVYR